MSNQCTTFGHRWDHTTSDTVRKCDFCSAKQVKVQGVWTTPPRVNRIQKRAKPVNANQMKMF